MKLIQLNTWWGGKLGDSLTNFLKKERPDILCLQEASSYNKSSDAGVFLPIETIQDIVGYKYSNFAPAHRFNFMNGKISLGNAILSKLPIASSHHFYTNLEFTDNFDFGVHDYNVRNLLHCVVKVKDSSVHVLTHHGHHVPHHKNGDNETLRQMQEIMEYVDQLSGPVILTGDFNLAPNSKSLEVISNKLLNLSAVYELKTTRNSLTPKNEVCDYIFVNNQIRVNNFQASNEIVSDHQALVMEFDITS